MVTRWEDVGLISLFRSPFLLPSVLLHAMIFLLALQVSSFSIRQTETPAPISVQLLETGGSDTKSIGRARGSGGPRAAPKLGSSIPPVQRAGSTDAGSFESSVPGAAAEAAPIPRPAPLPGPKPLATASQSQAVNVNETSLDSLVQVPTKAQTTHLPTSADVDQELSQRSLAALNKTGDEAGIRALQEGLQVPGALKAAGAGMRPQGVPGGSPTGTGMAGRGTGVGLGGGSNTGLKGGPSADYSQYLRQLEKRVHSVWRYPEDVTGLQKVAVRFTLDRAGKLVQAEVLESSDPRLNASAVEAMKRASPFPPIPESLKDLANEPLIIRFTVSIRVRS